MTKDCTQPLRIENIRALNGCAGRLFGAATQFQVHKVTNLINEIDIIGTIEPDTCTILTWKIDIDIIYINDKK